MKKILLCVCCGVLLCALSSKPAQAGGFPGQEPPPQMPQMQQDDDVKQMINDLKKELAETKEELNNVKKQLAEKDRYAGGEGELPAGCTLFQPLPVRQEKFQFFALNEFYFVKPRGFGPYVGIDENTQNVPQGRLDQLNFDYDLSFRIGGGVKLPQDKGEIAAYIWHYEDRVSRDFEADYIDDGAIGFRPVPNSLFDQFEDIDFTARLAHAWTNLEFNVFDLDYTKPIRVCRNVDLDVSAGPRIFWMEHKSLFTYFGDTDDEFVQVGEPFDATGAGPRVGGELRFYLPWDLEVYGGGWGSLLLTKVDGQYEFMVAQTGALPVPSTIKFRDDAVIYNIDATLGVSYAPKWLFNGNFKISGGYKIMIFPRIWPGMNGVEDLTFDGATLTTELAF